MTSGPPNVTAYELEAARRTLECSGWAVARTVHTYPPVVREGFPQVRVARQRVVGPGQVELVLVNAKQADEV